MADVLGLGKMMGDWSRYRSQKLVQAAQIVEIRFSYSGPPELYVGVGRRLMDYRLEEFVPSEPAMAARAKIGDYAVIYKDGYRGISPMRVFEDGYARVSEEAS